MYEHIFQKIGLAKNESRIYETLLREGELAVGAIANKSKVHRRNVYDSLKRLVDRGLVFEVLHRAEAHYEAVNPNKLMEMIEAKEKAIAKIMPELEKLYAKTSHDQDVYIYRGLEGWKNDMKDILDLADEIYFIDAKGAWLDERIREPFLEFAEKARKKGIKFYILFDARAKKSAKELKNYLKNVEYKFLPPACRTSCDIEIYANRVGILLGIGFDKFDPEASFTLIANQQVADAFRIWFKFLWDSIK